MSEPNLNPNPCIPFVEFRPPLSPTAASESVIAFLVVFVPHLQVQVPPFAHDRHRQ